MLDDDQDTREQHAQDERDAELLATLTPAEIALLERDYTELEWSEQDIVRALWRYLECPDV